MKLKTLYALFHGYVNNADLCNVARNSDLTDWKGVNTVVYRILFVYMGLIFFQGLICPSNSPQLLNASSSTASSPFTIAFTQGGWTWSADFINAIIIVAFISAGNGCIYVQSRALYSLALSGRAPRVFSITSKKGGQYTGPKDKLFLLVILVAEAS